MRLPPAKCRSGALAVLLAASCLLLGGFSVVTGLCIGPGPQAPEISLDLCHPLQAANPVADVVVARPASGSSLPEIFPRGSIVEKPVARLINFISTPNPPPPKALA
jgi:hypothetical protein